MGKPQHIISWRAKLYFCFFCFLCAVVGMFFSYEDFVNVIIREMIAPRFNFMAERIHDAAHNGWGKQVSAENYNEASAWMKSRLDDSFMTTRLSAFVYKDGKFYVKMSSEDPEKVPYMSDAQPLLGDYADELRAFLNSSGTKRAFRKYDAAKKSILSCIFPQDAAMNGERRFFCAEGQVYSQSAVRRAIGDLFEKFVLLMILAFLPFTLFAREVLSSRVDTLEKIVENRTKALQNALDKAEESMRLKAQFMANVNHELRTPLNAIAGFSELMVQEMFGPIGNEKYKEYAASIHSSAVLLTDLINRVLDAAKYESGGT
nr:MAG TPA: HisKA [Caudoviricetes sp.]